MRGLAIVPLARSSVSVRKMTSEMPADLHHGATGHCLPVGHGDRSGSVVLAQAASSSLLRRRLPGLPGAGVALPSGDRPTWLPGPLREAEQVVLLVLDGLGWLQLQSRAHFAPTMAGLEGGPISSVAPTTTATALTSLSLGMSPAAHGIVGYKFLVPGPSGRKCSTSCVGARARAMPGSSSRHARSPAATGVRWCRRCQSSAGPTSPIAALRRRTSRARVRSPGTSRRASPASSAVSLLSGERLVYAYYDGVDKVAHATGFGELYDAELGFVDWLVGDLLSCHAGWVGPGRRRRPWPGRRRPTGRSGGARSRWPKANCSAAKPGSGGSTADPAEPRPPRVAPRPLRGEAWVATRDEVVDAGVFGGVPSEEALERLGDVALVPLERTATLTRTIRATPSLFAVMAGLVPEEVLVPLLVGSAS